MHGHPKKKKKTYQDVKRKTQASLPSSYGLEKIQTPHRIPTGGGKSTYKSGKLWGWRHDTDTGHDTGINRYNAERGQQREARALQAQHNKSRTKGRGPQTDAQLSDRWMSDRERIWDPHTSRPTHQSHVSSENYNRARTDTGIRRNKDSNSAVNRKARSASSALARDMARDMAQRREHDISRHNPYGM